mmetsp:Transcript_34136/g.76864  ORF Transcript_34136/g.76864 Transcript_34136/m.76864 type:complete len:339 (-) Transcript_34136:128-1144(-)|eukprot:764006-Hanusia_phi.AAC.6
MQNRSKSLKPIDSQGSFHNLSMQGGEDNMNFGIRDEVAARTKSNERVARSVPQPSHSAPERTDLPYYDARFVGVDLRAHGAGAGGGEGRTPSAHSTDDNDTPSARIILTEEMACEIYSKRTFGETRSTLVAQEYGVSPKAIRDIWNRRTWSYATYDLWTAEELMDYRRSRRCEKCNTGQGGHCVCLPVKRQGRPAGAKDSKPRKKRQFPVMGGELMAGRELGGGLAMARRDQEQEEAVRVQEQAGGAVPQPGSQETTSLTAESKKVDEPMPVPSLSSSLVRNGAQIRSLELELDLPRDEAEDDWLLCPETIGLFLEVEPDPAFHEMEQDAIFAGERMS